MTSDENRLLMRQRLAAAEAEVTRLRAAIASGRDDDCPIVAHDPDMRRYGPIMTVHVRPAGGGESVEVEALIDTGATDTSFHPSILQRLGAPVIGEYTFTYNGAGAPTSSIYHVDLLLPNGMTLNGWPVHGFMPSSRVQALIGRDVLDMCSFSYDGPTKTWALECVTVKR